MKSLPNFFTVTLIGSLFGLAAQVQAQEETVAVEQPQPQAQTTRNRVKNDAGSPQHSIVGKLRGSQSRVNLIKNLEQLSIRRSVQHQALQEFMKHAQGTAQEAAAARLIELRGLGEIAKSMGPITGLVEEHRFELKQELRRSLQLFVKPTCRPASEKW